MWSLMRARCYQVWTRDAATRLRPDLHLIPLPASDWPEQAPGCLWLANTVPTPLAAWSDLWIWSALSRLIRAYLSTLYPHCYHTLSLSPDPVCSFTYWYRGHSSPLIGFLSQHSLDRWPKFVEKINDRGHPPSFITAWHRFLQCSRVCQTLQCY